MRYFGKSDKGLERSENQDSFCCFEFYDALVCVLCDGMGGGAYGKLAADIALETFSEKFKEFSLDYIKSPAAFSMSVTGVMKRALRYANKAVYDKSIEMNRPREIGTTLVCTVIYDGMIYAINVGDSRLYEFFDGSLTKLTKDHSYVQLLIDIGRIKEKEAELYDNGSITKALGLESSVEADTYVIDLYDDSVYLLCSDGLYNMIGEQGILEGLKLVTNGEDPESAVQNLIQEALNAGGFDNITAVIIAS